MKLHAPLPCLFVGILLLTGSGCVHQKSSQSTVAASPAPAIVTPDNSLSARVVSYNSVGRFVVLSFPVGKMPAMSQSLFLYRNGLKVAEIKVTGPQQDNNTVADLITGNAQVGDEVRDQ
jgi:hypothetical protein